MCPSSSLPPLVMNVNFSQTVQDWFRLSSCTAHNSRVWPATLCAQTYEHVVDALLHHCRAENVKASSTLICCMSRLQYSGQCQASGCLYWFCSSKLLYHSPLSKQREYSVIFATLHLNGQMQLGRCLLKSFLKMLC